MTDLEKLYIKDIVQNEKLRNMASGDICKKYDVKIGQELQVFYYVRAKLTIDGYDYYSDANKKWLVGELGSMIWSSLRKGLFEILEG